MVSEKGEMIHWKEG